MKAPTMERIVEAKTPHKKGEPIKVYHYIEEDERLLDDVPSWVRYGHTRKPNRVVLWLYDVFDWIADFFPMFSAFFRFIKKTVVGTWGLFVRIVLTVVNIAILVGLLYVSVGHSYELLTIYGGMSGVAAWVLVGVWETVFIYCSTLIDIKYRKGKKSNWADWTGFLMGWVFVEVSNYMGMSDNLIGKAAGLATPVLLLVMKKVLQKQFSNDEQKRQSWFVRLFNWFSRLFEKKSNFQTIKESVGEMVENGAENGIEIKHEMVEKVVEKVVEDDTIFDAKNGSETVENDTGSNTISEERNGTEKERATVKETVEEQLEKLPESSHQTVNEEVEKHSQQEKPEPEISMDQVDEKLPVVNEKEAIPEDDATKETVEETVKDEAGNDTGNDEKMVKETVKNEAESDTGNGEEVVKESVKNETGSDTANDEKAVRETVKNDTGDDTGNDEKVVEETVDNTGDDEKAVKGMVENQTEKKTTKRKKLVTPSQLKRSVKRFAKQYMKENGKPPGRVAIEKEFGINQSLARKLAEFVKEELKVS